MGSRGRDIRRAAREGGHPPKVVGSGKGERASRVGEDKGTSHSHGRIPIAVLGSNQCQDHGRSFAVIGRATISIASLRSLIDCCIFRFISSKNYRAKNRAFCTFDSRFHATKERSSFGIGTIVQIYFSEFIVGQSDRYSRTTLSRTKREYSRQCSIEARSRGMSPSSPMLKNNDYYRHPADPV